MYFPGSKDKRFAGVSSDDMIEELRRRCDGWDDELVKVVLGVELLDDDGLDEMVAKVVSLAGLVKARARRARDEAMPVDRRPEPDANGDILFA